MTTLHATSLLRLPAGQPETAAVLPPDGLRARLEELGRRAFDGRVELQADDWRAELLLRQGRPLAAALNGPALEQPLAGQAALEALLGQAAVPWTCRLERLEPDLLATLAGVGASPEPRPLAGAPDLRGLLRDLAVQGEPGVLEVSQPSRWARVLIAAGRVLGSYSDAAPERVPSLAPLGDLLGSLPCATWYAGRAAAELRVPPAPIAAGDGTAEVEQRVIWIVSRFEAACGRARERGGEPADLYSPLVQLLDHLQGLANALEAPAGATVGAAVAALPDSAEPRPAAEVDYRLAGLGVAQALPLLVELVGQALSRVIRACPDPSLADCCRQAALALDADLRKVLPAQTAPAGRSGVDR